MVYDVLKIAFPNELGTREHKTYEIIFEETGPKNKGNDAPENISGRVIADEKINWTFEFVDKFVKKSF